VWLGTSSLALLLIVHVTDLNLSTNNCSRSRRPVTDDDDMYVLLFVHLHYSNNILFIALITVLSLVLLPRLNLSDRQQMMMICMSFYLYVCIILITFWL
jgi:hypothetical protein